jgi:hypothetical protein
MVDFSELREVLDNNAVGEPHFRTRFTPDYVRNLVRKGGGSIALETKDWGDDRIFITCNEGMFHPYPADDAAEGEQDNGFYVIHLLQDGYLAGLEGPMSLIDAFDQMTEWNRTEIFNY